MAEQKVSRAEHEVSEALHRYYYTHHDGGTLRQDLVKIVNETRVRTFTEIKRAIVDATASRVTALLKEVVIVKNDSFGNNDRVNELEKLRNYVRGMVVKVDEDQA